MMSVKKKSAPIEEQQATPIKAKGIFSGFLLIKLAIIIVGVIGIGVGIYFYLQYDKTKKLLKNPTLAAETEQRQLVDKVGKLIDLPKDEQPTIATVSDVTKLKDQPFFAKAKNGNKVLIYTKGKKAILYDPLSNKIIEVGPINTDQQADTQTSLQAEESKVVPSSVKASVQVALYNGTKTVGLARTVELQLKEKLPNITVVKKTNASADYAKTLVVDLTGKQKEVASQLAKLLNGKIGNLPKGETKPASVSADILVILGK